MARPQGSKTVKLGANVFVNVGKCVVQIHQTPDSKLHEIFYDEQGICRGRKVSTIKDVLCYFKGATRKDWIKASAYARSIGIRPIMVMKERFLD